MVAINTIAGVFLRSDNAYLKLLRAVFTTFCIVAYGPIFALGENVESNPRCFEQDLSWGDTTIILKAEPAKVAPERDLILTLNVSHPSYLRVALPDLRDRFNGFTTVDDFAGEPLVTKEKTVREYRWRLTPKMAQKYRLAPFAVSVTDTRRQPPLQSSFATRPIIFPVADPPPPADGKIEADLTPLWVPPTPLDVLTWIGIAMLIIILLALIVLGLLRIKRHVHELRLSPRERAFAELERLLRQKLIEKGKYKDFYIELTMVVRRYIERSHGIKAPEQTTQEFLEAAAKHPRFTKAVLDSLRHFLESSDLIKFAGVAATPTVANAAVDTARQYITTDANVNLSQQAEPVSSEPCKKTGT